MSRKTCESHHGLNDVISVALLAGALLLLVAQLSFDRGDISFLTTQANKSTHNWIGPIGAYLAWFFFLSLGATAYLAPLLLAAFGVAHLLNHPRSAQYMRARKKHIAMCSLRSLTCLQVQVLPRQWMVGPSSDSRPGFGGDPDWGKLCRKRAGKSVAQAAGKDWSAALAKVQAAT